MIDGTDHTMWLPARREASFVRISIALPVGFSLVFVSTKTILGLNYSVTAYSNRVVEYSLALAMLVLLAIGSIILLLGLRWLAFALWPIRLGALVDSDALRLRLGPFGYYVFHASETSARYRSEIEDPSSGYSTEDFISPEQERLTRLPIMHHQSQPINDLLLRFISKDEAHLVQAMQPFIEESRRS